MSMDSANVPDNTTYIKDEISHNIIVTSDRFIIHRGILNHIKMKFVCLGTITAGEEDEFKAHPMDLSSIDQVDVGNVEVAYVIKLPWGSNDSNKYQSCAFVLMNNMIYGFRTTNKNITHDDFKYPLVYCEKCSGADKMEDVLSTAQKLYEHGFKKCFEATANEHDGAAYRHGLELMKMRDAKLEHVAAAKACAEMFVQIVKDANGY